MICDGYSLLRQTILGQHNNLAPLEQQALSSSETFLHTDFPMPFAQSQSNSNSSKTFEWLPFGFPYSVFSSKLLLHLQ
ncbi:CLUMA_CG002452, isoform A [Clunio marinus]|uniref:CLUMA_CG002452, isoform A n=1 Tax=Clunio marinus TaxID=568069 RepID=A0A1J1HMC9_9DIPT|nr:CLUMA_CG002452, isoform A [Clunio marinus]